MFFLQQYHYVTGIMHFVCSDAPSKVRCRCLFDLILYSVVVIYDPEGKVGLYDLCLCIDGAFCSNSSVLLVLATEKINCIMAC